MELITEKEYVVPLISHKEQKKLMKLIEELNNKKTIIIQRQIKKKRSEKYEFSRNTSKH